VEEEMIKVLSLLAFGISGIILSPNLVSDASAQTGYCCRDPWLVFDIRVSRTPCPGNEAPGRCKQYYCLNADIDRAWKQRSGVFNCDAAGYNYEISKDAYDVYAARGQVVRAPQ
jgi:hypothetical protein